MGLTQHLSVNISAGHLLMPEFVEELTAMLERHRELGRHSLELEILETAALEDLDRASSVFERCRALNVRIALDDFGTGYSSLSYFRRLPADTLKIDQSFVCSMLHSAQDLAIVKGLVGLAQAFKRELVAEGVETPQLGALLVQIGCHIGQGYGIAPPMSPERVPAWLADFRPDPLWSGAGRARRRWSLRRGPSTRSVDVSR
jgi:EAL domain-containing protein (putative c-di-GMP-specific phosphodiesterase class I)